MSEPLWRPTATAVAGSQLTEFTARLRAQGVKADNYDQLHAWSVAEPGAFWQAFWDYTGIVSSTPPRAAVEDVHLFPGARWFPGARLNFAENLLQERSGKTAFVALLENGRRETRTYNELYDETAKLAWQLRQLGLQPGDRVAGWLPNISQAASAMLATASFGGVWSSCSPDFGEPGALDRFGQIEPKVLFACDGYYYAGKTLDIRSKVRNVARQVPSIRTIVWVPVLEPQELQPQPPAHDAGAADAAAAPVEVMVSDWLAAPAQALTFTQLPFDHPLYILYSSGTTGKPKCIVHGQGGTLLQHKKEHQLHLDLRPEDVLFFFTTCGWMMWNWLISALASRCTVVLFDGSPFHPGAEAMFDICGREQVSVFGISAKFLSGAQKAGVEPARSHPLAAMRMLISTGSPLTQEGFQYVYNDIKADCHLVSMSGGTDLISCFMLGNPNLPVYEGELQSPGLGMAVDIWDDRGWPLAAGKGELVCTRPFPSAPVGFWNDPDERKYRSAYFDRFDNVWVHGDYAERTSHGGYIIHGRSDAVLNPGGVRIGTAEIYRQVEYFDEVVDAVCVGQQWQDDVRVVLFVVLRDQQTLTAELTEAIRLRIRQYASPRHTPAKVLAVADIPRTMSGKIAELAVRDTIHGRAVKNTSALANPEALAHFAALGDALAEA